MKLLIIEDNRRIATRIKAEFSKYHNVELAYTGEAGIEKATIATFDAILLDLGLPDMSGLEVCKQLRFKGVTAPLLVLTGVDEPALKVKLLNSGADDYVTKPYQPLELIARVNAIARRKDQQFRDTILKVKDLTINMTCREVAREGGKIRLRRKEYEVLEYLITNRGRALSRMMILNHVWGSDRENWNNTVDVHIKHLRDKIDAPFHEKLIKTVYGVGYTIDDDK